MTIPMEESKPKKTEQKVIEQDNNTFEIPVEDKKPVVEDKKPATEKKPIIEEKEAYNGGEKACTGRQQHLLHTRGGTCKANYSCDTS